MNSMTSYKSSKLYGEVVVPGDKSISHRALILGSLVTGKIKIKKVIENNFVHLNLSNVLYFVIIVLMFFLINKD